jgi:PAS domain S-box-containing protein
MNEHTKTHPELIEEVSVLNKRIKERENKESEQGLEEGLRQEYSFRNAIINNVAEGLCVCHETTESPFIKFTIWNDRMTKITGYTVEEINRRGWYQTLYPDSGLQAKAIERMKRMRQREDIRAEEWEITRADGENRVLNISTSIVESNDGMTHVLGLMQDITEQKLAEEALRNSETKYRLIAENTADLITILDMNLRYTYVSPAVVQLRGFTVAETMEQTLEQVLTPESMRLSLGVFKEEIQLENSGKADPKRTRILEVQAYKKDGSIIWMEVSLSFLRDEGSKPVSILIISRDITERKRSEEALIESEKRLKLVTDNVPALIGYVDKNYRYQFVNRNYERWFGLKQEEMLGRSIKDLLPKGTYEISLPFVNRALAGEEVSFEGIVRLPDSTTKVFHNHLVPDRSLKDEIMGYYVLVSDITDSKRVEKELQNTLESLRRAVNTTIQVMVSAVEVRDPYTSGHQVRSADLARAIATEMGLPQDKIDAIRMAGSIHDIGKLSIPAEILSKPTKLSEIEFSLIKEHARRGFEMLKDVESPWPLAEIVFQHHERMDGSGYPRNLQGEEILIEARILHVADVVEAMASHRPYRPGLGIEAALEEIEQNKGIFYDNAVVDACLKLFKDKRYKLEV